MGGQEHFYLETHCALAVPQEDDGIEIYSATQDAFSTQMFVAHMLDIPANKVNVRVKRLGGGFGGKETRCNVLSLPVAFAAHR